MDLELDRVVFRCSRARDSIIHDLYHSTNDRSYVYVRKIDRSATLETPKVSEMNLKTSRAVLRFSGARDSTIHEPCHTRDDGSYLYVLENR